MSAEGYLSVFQISPSGAVHPQLPPRHVSPGISAQISISLCLLSNFALTGPLVVFQILCWLIALLVLSINGYLLVVFLLTQAPQNVGVHAALLLGAAAYLSLIVYLGLGPEGAARLREV
jgi:hypothetical protein